jgi:hypothetical protein
VGRIIDGLSAGLDQISGLTNEAKIRSYQILRDLRHPNVEESLRRHLGRFIGISPAQVLLTLLCEYEEQSNGGRIEMESGATSESFMRSLWRCLESARSPHRRQYRQQCAQQYSDALRELSRNSSSLFPQAWSQGSWEDGTPRIMSGVKNRSHRLKGLGNAIVPQIPEAILGWIGQIERGELS